MKKLLLSLLLLLFFTTYLKAQNCLKKCSEEYYKAESGKYSSVDEKEKRLFYIGDSLFKMLKGCHFTGVGVQNVNGGELNMDNYKGRLVFIHFWFEACPPCVAEIPDINKLQKDYSDKNVAFIAISTDNLQQMQKFLTKKPFNSSQFQIDRNVAIEEYCLIAGYPTNIVLDKSGNLIDIWSGGNTDPKKHAEFYDKVKTILDKNL